MKKRREDFMFVNFVSSDLHKRAGQIAGNSFKIANLRDCRVVLADTCGSVYIDNCVDCVISIGPTDSSIFVRKCQNLKLSAAAQQLRISDSSDVLAFVFSAADLALENASHVRLAPYNFVYAGIRQHMEQAGLSVPNRGFKVHDFTPGAEPHFSIERDAKLDWNCFECGPDEPKPLDWPVSFGGVLSDEQLMPDRSADDGKDAVTESMGTMMSFRLATNRKEAQAQIDRIAKLSSSFLGQTSQITDETSVQETEDLTAQETRLLSETNAVQARSEVSIQIGKQNQSAEQKENIQSGAPTATKEVHSLGPKQSTVTNSLMLIRNLFYHRA